MLYRLALSLSLSIFFIISPYNGFAQPKDLNHSPQNRLIHSENISQISNSKDYIAKINSRYLTIAQVKKELIKHGIGKISHADNFKERLMILDELVAFEVIAKEAEKYGYMEEEKEKEYGRKKMVREFLEKEVFSKVKSLKITDKQLEDYYHKNLMDFHIPEKRRACLILIHIPAKASKSERMNIEKKAREAYEKVKRQTRSFETFGILSSKYSDDANTKNKGGDLGWLIKNTKRPGLNPKIIDNVFSLEGEGSVSELIKTKNAYFIVKLVRKKLERTESLDRVRGRIYKILLQEEKEKIKERYYKNIKDSYEISINNDLLRSIKLKEDGLFPPSFPVTSTNN